jgi:hypothetical protein
LYNFAKVGIDAVAFLILQASRLKKKIFVGKKYFHSGMQMFVQFCKSGDRCSGFFNSTVFSFKEENICAWKKMKAFT